MAIKITNPGALGVIGDIELAGGSFEFYRTGTNIRAYAGLDRKLTKLAPFSNTLDLMSQPVQHLWMPNLADFDVCFRDSSGAVIVRSALADAVGILNCLSKLSARIADLIEGGGVGYISDLDVFEMDTYATLSWTPNGRLVSVYRRNVTADGVFDLVASDIAADATFHDDTGLSPATAYQWRLTSTDGESTSGSNTVSKTTLASYSQTTNDKRGILLPNAYGHIFDGAHPDGDNVAPTVIRHFYTNFEDGTLGHLAVKGTDSLAVVENAPYSGTRCLRGNLATGLAGNDPLTGKPRNSNPIDFSLAFKTGGASRSWKKVFIRYRLRFDDADNRDASNLITNMKLGYISDVYNDSTGDSITSTTSAIYPTMSARGGCGIYSLAVNNSGGNPAPDWGGSAIITSAVNRGLNYDGTWNLIEILVDHENHTIAFWVNGIKVVSNSGQPLVSSNGDYPTSSTFTADHISLFHADAEEWVNSTNRTGEKGGFQIDEFECWEGDPRPLEEE